MTIDKIVDDVCFDNPSYEEVTESKTIEKIWHFRNGYGAMVTKGLLTLGSEQGLWELAMIKFIKDGIKIVDDIIGYLDESEIETMLIEINNIKNSQ